MKDFQKKGTNVISLQPPLIRADIGSFIIFNMFRDSRLLY